MYMHLVVVFPEEAIPREKLLEFARVETYWIMFSETQSFVFQHFRKFHP